MVEEQVFYFKSAAKVRLIMGIGVVINADKKVARPQVQRKVVLAQR
jgi:hypothetical protein